jgi:hypothetical protein
VKIVSVGGSSNRIGSMYLHCDIETLDAEKISVNNGTNTFQFLGSGEISCFCNMYYHDRKWGI